MRKPSGIRGLVRLRHESGRFSSTAGSRRTHPFRLVNANLHWQLRRGIGLQFGVLNAGDKDYAYEKGFPEPGRTWFSTFSVSYRGKRGGCIFAPRVNRAALPTDRRPYSTSPVSIALR